MLSRFKIFPAVLLSIAFVPGKVHAAADASKTRQRVLLVPPAALGEVREILQKRVGKAMSDALAVQAQIELLTDKDRAEKTAPDKPKAGPKQTFTSRQIEEADLMRQEGTDAASEGKHSEALGKFRGAISMYEKSYMELVDYSKLADAYARAGISGFQAGVSAAEVTRWFEAGVAIQPTLVIDRRKQSKELLDLFDGAHERAEKSARAGIAVDGTAAGAEVFVDGVKIGPLPASKADLFAGTHYVQVRGEGLVPWGTVVKLKGKETKVTAKVVEIKKTAAAIPEVELKIDALAECAKTGTFMTEKCKHIVTKLSKQTGADFLLFCAIKADRYGRIGLNPFVMEAASLAVVSLKPVDLAADLGDLNAKSAVMAGDLDTAIHPFDKKRGLTKPPAVFK